jgi:CubicO group peptidase (beta-lactamase class C family)
LPATQTDLLKAINNLKLAYSVENKTLFSELGAFVLGNAIAKVTKQTLPDAMFQTLTIVGMRDTGYLPKTDKLKIAPGGYAGEVAWGTPFNRLAHFMGGIAGNGGIFSTVSDVITYTQLLLNKGKMPNHFRVWEEATVEKFLNVTKYKYTNTRTMGWETIPATGACPCGKKFSPTPNSFGASDTLTGSFIWNDKVKNVTIVLLANGAFPGGRINDPTAWQGAISDAVMTALGH